MKESEKQTLTGCRWLRSYPEPITVAAGEGPAGWRGILKSRRSSLETTALATRAEFYSIKYCEITTTSIC